jgi:sugar phosphate isomerase/epimerase
MHVSSGDDPPPPNSEGLAWMKRLLSTAASHRVTIAVENTARNEALRFLFESIDSPYLGFCYDSSHDFLHSREPVRILESFGGRLAYTHFSDTDGRLESHRSPGDGTIDWALIQRKFPKGYGKPISLEVYPKDAAGEAPMDFLRRAKAKWAWLEGMLRK